MHHLLTATAPALALVAGELTGLVTSLGLGRALTAAGPALLATSSALAALLLATILLAASLLAAKLLTAPLASLAALRALRQELA